MYLKFLLKLTLKIATLERVSFRGCWGFVFRLAECPGALLGFCARRIYLKTVATPAKVLANKTSFKTLLSLMGAFECDA